MSGTSTNGRARSLTVHQDAQAMIDRARDEGITTGMGPPGRPAAAMWLLRAAG